MQALCNAEVCNSWEAGSIAVELLRWNKAHKTGKLAIGSDLDRLLKAVTSTKGRNIVQQWLDCTTVEGQRACRYCRAIKAGESQFNKVKVERPWEPPDEEEVIQLARTIELGFIGCNTERTAFVVKRPDGSNKNLLKWEGEWVKSLSGAGWGNRLAKICCSSKERWEEFQKAAHVWAKSGFEVEEDLA